MNADIDGLLGRLVGQFASPYDFLRELVQNAMDAGADQVEVTLETHPVGDDSDQVTFELSILDTGVGMDERTIDGELTRLFASSKGGDRTKAGGFGIGFVSVFAWEPERVLLHTGRAGESWELLFHADRTFEKHPVDVPLEGTTIRMFRRGMAAQRAAIAGSVRDALWRWCRFCPIEILFEDLDGERGLELIQDAPDGDDGVALAVHEQGPTRIVASYGVPAQTILLRKGLVLAEGSTSELLPDLAKRLGPILDHVRVHADSPALRTTLARDKVVDDDGRRGVQARVESLVAQLRAELVEKLVTLAGETTWSPELAARYGHLHAHLSHELQALGAPLQKLELLRDVSKLRPWSLDRLRGAGVGNRIPVAPGATGAGAQPAAETDDGLVETLSAHGIPVLHGERGDRTWLEPLLARANLVAARPEEAFARVEPDTGAGALCGVVQSLLRRAGHRDIEIRAGRFSERGSGTTVCGLEVKASSVVIVRYPGPEQTPVGGRLRVWLDLQHPIVHASVRVAPSLPRFAALTVALAVAGDLGGPLPDALATALDDVA